MTVDQNISSRINLMRILLISGIVFVHVPHNPATSPFTGTFGLFDWLRVFLGDSFFRVGVPCLSAISGYLLFQRGMPAFNYGKVLKSKGRTVLTPFLLWNMSLILLVLIIQKAGIGIGYFPDLWQASFREFLSHAFGLEGLPVNLPLYFLRDLLVCIMLSPILAFFVLRAPMVTCGLLFVLAVLPDVTIGIVLKKSILFSFTFGIFLALRRIDTKAADRHAVAGVALTITAAALLAVGLYWTGPSFPFGLDLARNTLSILGAVGFWLLSALLIRTRVGQKLAGTGSLSFWIFCAHYPLLVVLWMVWNRVNGDDPALYPYFYAGSIITTFVVLTLTNRFVSGRLPALYQVLTGSRGRKKPAFTQAENPNSPAGAGAPGAVAMSQQQR
ncbi:acyltransferase [Neorhizobium sp. T786]|uniref:acyltransferase family protein n=1 Tax=Pseudorhizobium xiangyangii TaxID=2883104 RepID=UPI001CFF82D3|nr:acyltransferase [Neorhizobium xiangyangii]MCB5204877.1 acyltransferase [Neorhizobium xiangyangii]